MSSDLLNKAESMEYLLKKLKFREEKPKFIDVNPISQMAQGLKEGILECGAMEKVKSTIYYLLQYTDGYRISIFTLYYSTTQAIVAWYSRTRYLLFADYLNCYKTWAFRH